MMNPIWISVGILGLFAAAAWIAIWSRRDTWGRPAAIALFIIGLPTIAAASIESLGHHRPFWAAWDLPPGEHRVIGAKMIQDVGIWIYLDTGREAPWPLVLPFSNETANRIQKALDGAPKGQEGQFLMRFDPSLDENELQFHPLPQSPALPAKPEPEPGVIFDGGE